MKYSRTPDRSKSPIPLHQSPKKQNKIFLNKTKDDFINHSKNIFDQHQIKQSKDDQVTVFNKIKPPKQIQTMFKQICCPNCRYLFKIIKEQYQQQKKYKQNKIKQCYDKQVQTQITKDMPLEIMNLTKAFEIQKKNIKQSKYSQQSPKKRSTFENIPVITSRYLEPPQPVQQYGHRRIDLEQTKKDPKNQLFLNISSIKNQKQALLIKKYQRKQQFTHGINQKNYVSHQPEELKEMLYENAQFLRQKLHELFLLKQMFKYSPFNIIQIPSCIKVILNK